MEPRQMRQQCCAELESDGPTASTLDAATAGSTVPRRPDARGTVPPDDCASDATERIGFVDSPRMGRPSSRGRTSVRDRLVAAADLELAEHGLLTGRMEAVARRAGVSRATAYRQMGTISELLAQVGLRRSRLHAARIKKIMHPHRRALEKIEAALVYCAAELPREPLVVALIYKGRQSTLDPEVVDICATVLGPVLVAGQQHGEIRVDIDLRSLIDYLAEQCCLAIEMPDRSAQAVHRRFQSFIVPSISALVRV